MGKGEGEVGDKMTETNNFNKISHPGYTDAEIGSLHQVYSDLHVLCCCWIVAFASACLSSVCMFRVDEFDISNGFLFAFSNHRLWIDIDIHSDYIHMICSLQRALKLMLLLLLNRRSL